MILSGDARDRFLRIKRSTLPLGLVMTAGPAAVAIGAVLLDGYVRLGSVFGVTILAVLVGIGWVGGWLSGVGFLAWAASRQSARREFSKKE